MKLKNLLIIFIILTSVKSIAQSDSTRINLTLNNKIEVLKTLTVYPLVLDKIYLQNELIESSNKLIQNLNQRTENNDILIRNLEDQIKALDKEKKLFNTQLKKQKLKSVKVGGVGLVLIIVSILVVK